MPISSKLPLKKKKKINTVHNFITFSSKLGVFNHLIYQVPCRLRQCQPFFCWWYYFRVIQRKSLHPTRNYNQGCGPGYYSRIMLFNTRGFFPVGPANPDLDLTPDSGYRISVTSVAIDIFCWKNPLKFDTTTIRRTLFQSRDYRGLYSAEWSCKICWIVAVNCWKPIREASPSGLRIRIFWSDPEFEITRILHFRRVGLGPKTQIKNSSKIDRFFKIFIDKSYTNSNSIWILWSNTF